MSSTDEEEHTEHAEHPSTPSPGPKHHHKKCRHPPRRRCCRPVPQMWQYNFCNTREAREFYLRTRNCIGAYYPFA